MEKSFSKESNVTRIAVIGIGCTYPGAKTPLQFWENILARRQQFREMPDSRLPNKEYYDSDPNTPDKTYQNRAAVIDDYEFDWIGKKIPKQTYESTDIAHWMALDTTLKAIEDAGYNIKDLPKETTGAVFGNTFMGEFTRSNMQRLRWPYVQKVLRASLEAKGLSHMFGELAPTMESIYKSVFAPVTEDTLAGGLPNTIAGRVCNYLNVNGGGYIVDGACSSSLISVYTACNHLENGEMDVAIAGGIDISLDTFELIGFAKTKALAKIDMQVYDKKGNGFLPGEGCGVVILKRLEDAIRDNDQIYSVVSGWGIASDGAGGITAPSDIGQSRALKRAWAKGQVDTKKLDFIEGHGTGTTVGDRIELQGITLALDDENPLDRNVGITSLKSIVGHTKAAAGVGAFIKTSMALNQRIIPPTAGVEELNPVFFEKAFKLYPVLHGSKEDPGRIMQAGVSAMGFGGINCHVVLESGAESYKKLHPEMDEKKIMATKQWTEVVLFSSKDIEGLKASIRNARERAERISVAELSDFAAQHNNQIVAGGYGAAVVAKSPFDLLDKLDLALEKCNELNETNPYIVLEGGAVALGKRKADLKIGMLFPGQASQQLNSSRILVARHEWASEISENANKIFTDAGSANILNKLFIDREKALNEETLKSWKKDLTQTQTAQPAIVLSSLLWKNYLSRLNIHPTAVTGHSLGELAAFYSAGQLDLEEVLKFAVERGKIMAETGSGAMASLRCNLDVAEELVANNAEVCIANINTPNQIIISGEEKGIEETLIKAKEKNIAGSKINVSAAFHSHLMAESSKLIEGLEVLKKSTTSGDVSLVSCMSGEDVKNDIALNDYFSKQVINGVNFIKAIESICQKTDVLIEVGPGKVLSNLATQINPDVITLPVEGVAEHDADFNKMIASIFVLGADVNTQEIYANRFVRDFIPASEKSFIRNPLERPLKLDDEIINTTLNTGDLEAMMSDLGILSTGVGDYLKTRGGFIREVIQSDMKYQNMLDIPATGIVSKKIIEKKTLSSSSVKNSTLSIEDQVKTFIFKEVENLTGFPSTGIKPESRLLDDFNLDSIKSGTLIVAILKEFNAVGKLEPVKYANASLQEIVSDTLEVIDVKSFSGNESGTEDIAAKVKSKLFSVVEDMTGFPEDTIGLNSRLLDDFNLDSIKSGTLLVEVLKEFDLAGKLEPVKYANASLQEIVDDVLQVLDEEGIVSVASTRSSVSLEEQIKNKLFDLVEEKTGFPKDRISEDWKLLDDANLDSIKAGSLIADISNEFDQKGNLEPIKYANASLFEIKNALLELMGSSNSPKEQKAQKAYSEWVRSYTSTFQYAELDTSDDKVAAYWKDKSVGIYALEEQRYVAEEIKKVLVNNVKSVQILDKTSFLDAESSNLESLFIVAPKYDAISLDNFDSFIDYFQTIAVAPALKYNTKLDLAFVGFGEGNFNRELNGKAVNKINISNNISFASSIHLEKPGFKVRIFDLHSDNDLPKSCNLIQKDFLEISPIEAIAFDKNGKRFRLVNELVTKELPKRDLSFEKDEVILVSGGGKGITAECGIALSKEYKCKFAILGSTPLDANNDTINNNIKRYLEHATDCRYFSCDMSDEKAVKETIRVIESEMGSIAGILHGAGKNHPSRLELLTHEGIVNEVSPKLKGAIYLTEAFKDKKLKLLTGITSILGITGMRGNSSYCLSNETLDLIIRKYKQEHPETHTATFAYSIWAEVGMGVKMGSIDALSHLGIGSIPPEDGIRGFMDGVLYQVKDQQVAVTSNIYGIDSWRRDTPKKPKANRYLEQVIIFEPGVELAVRSKLNIQKDLYLEHHNYNGSYLFPTVFGIEAMSQAVAYTMGVEKLDSVRLEKINLSKPIVVAEKGDLEIEIKTMVSHPMDSKVAVHVGISTEHSNFTENHFEAVFYIDKTQIEGSADIEFHKESLDIQPKTDLYSWLLFQGEKFQHLKSIYKMSPGEVQFSTADNNQSFATCFGEGLANEFALGNPLVRDTLLQSGQLLFTDKQYLPISIDKWTINNTAYNLEGKELASCQLNFVEEDIASCDVHAFDAESNYVELIEGYNVKALKETPDYPSISEVADMTAFYNGILQSSIKEYVNGDMLEDRLFNLARHSDISNLQKKDRHIIQNKIISDSFNGNKDRMQLDWDAKGKPSLNVNESDKMEISISHAGDFMLFGLGKELQACDIEFIEERDIATWTALLNSKIFSLVEELSTSDKDLHKSATRLWCVKEILVKAIGLTDIEIKNYSITNDGITFEVAVGESIYHILTFPANLMQRKPLMIAMLINITGDMNVLLN